MEFPGKYQATSDGTANAMYGGFLMAYRWIKSPRSIILMSLTILLLLSLACGGTASKPVVVEKQVFVEKEVILTRDLIDLREL